MDDTPPHISKPAARPSAVRYRWLLWLMPLVILLLMGALLVPLPQHGRLGSAVGDLLHAPVFAVVALGLYGAARRLGFSKLASAGSVWMLLTLFGAATEVAQAYVGRSESWQDGLHDALGAAGGVLMGIALEASTRVRRIGIIVVGLFAILSAQFNPMLTIWDCYQQSREMPQLASFESWLEPERWSTREAQMQRVADHATEGRWALRVDLGLGQYPTIVLTEPSPDWSAYQDLVFDIDVEPAAAEENQAAPLELIVKIQDKIHNGNYDDRFHRILRLTPGRHEIRIPLSEVASAPRGRKLDLKQIHMLQFFSIAPPQPRTFYLDHVRLE